MTKEKKPAKRWKKWLLIGLAVVFVPPLLLVAMSALAPGTLHGLLHGCHTVEPTEGLDKIKVGALNFFTKERHDEQGNLLPARFPRSTPPTPAKPRCEKAITPATQWDRSPGWGELQFRISEPHYYSFQFESHGEGHAAEFKVRAIGDLDCDGELATFELRGSVDDEGKVTTVGPIITNEIE